MAQNLPVTVYILCALHNNLIYGRNIYNSWNNELNTEYALLVYKLVMETKHMGFVPDDDEFKLIKGTHPLFDEIKVLRNLFTAPKVLWPHNVTERDRKRTHHQNPKKRQGSNKSNRRG